MKITLTPQDDVSCGWFHLSKPRKPKPSHEGTSAARWVVVGAGFTGLAAARQLAVHYPNDEIILIEAQVVGYGASGRNAGFAIDLPHDIGAEDYIGDIEIAKKTLKLNTMGQTIIKDLTRQYSIDCQLRESGKYQGAVEPRGIAVLDAYRRGLDKLGQNYEMIEEADLPGHLGTTFYKKAIFSPGTVLLQPSALVKGLADSLPDNVTLYENTLITDVEYGQKIVLSHQSGKIIADKLVLANNAFGMGFGFLKGRMLPVFTYGSLTRVLSEEEQSRLAGKSFWGLTPADPFGSTIRRTADNRIFVRNSFSFNRDGKSHEKYLQRFVRRHRESYERRFPMLSGVEFDYTWGGSLSLSRNHMGHFGELRPNVYGALCCNGLGVTRGTVTGTLLADWLAGQRNEMIDFLLKSNGPNANPPEPFLSIGVNATLMWSQFRAGKES
ncbi:FAD-binding oxidoreductase [Pseudogulbenkiania sp. MAI-1]|uniref:NAD(P)/FAD-dependent oxidoreductase n=1 Tax=Pseudogulbenkiania sp. MAI-1 TaxID=990370 RepID=UPI000A034ADF|nr:FAD-binding oxidoreductase [Pseudogulbenkiania sp. MAI-1]